MVCEEGTREKKHPVLYSCNPKRGTLSFHVHESGMAVPRRAELVINEPDNYTAEEFPRDVT